MHCDFAEATCMTLVILLIMMINDDDDDTEDDAADDDDDDDDDADDEKVIAVHDLSRPSLCKSNVKTQFVDFGGFG